MFAVDLFSVFDTVIGEHFTWTNQMLVNMARFFTPEFTRWVADRIIAQIRRREEAYSDLSGMAIASMLASESPELARLLDDDSDESAAEEARETISAFIGSIVSGLPLENSKYLKRTIDLVMGGLSRFYSQGCSDTVLPDERLKPGEITVNADVWKIMRKAYRKAGRELKLGSEVIIARHPNTGTEAAMCRVVGIGRTAVNPLWWGSRFNGDFDGDRIAICFAELDGISSFVDDSLVEEFIISIPESGKGKTNLTVAEAVAAGVYSQAMIPIADRYLRIANEAGIPGDRIIHLIELLNNTIDSAKHDKSVDHAMALSLSGLDVNADTSYLQKILTGSFGSREYRVMNYNRYVDLAREERTSIEWANIVRESGVLFNLFPGSGDPDYASTIKNLDINNITKGYKFEMVVDYINSLKRHGLEEMVGVLKNHEPQATIPSEILGSSRGAALRERASQIGLLPRMTARRCFDSYKLFLENIRRGDVTTTQAYQPIRDAVTLVRESEHGDAAMKWLFASLAFNCDPNIRMKAMYIMAYMPLKVGSYNLRKVLEFLGYERKFNLIITR
jgi:hypothetical protein